MQNLRLNPTSGNILEAVGYRTKGSLHILATSSFTCKLLSNIWTSFKNWNLNPKTSAHLKHTDKKNPKTVEAMVEMKACPVLHKICFAHFLLSSFARHQRRFFWSWFRLLSIRLYSWGIHNLKWASCLNYSTSLKPLGECPFVMVVHCYWFGCSRMCRWNKSSDLHLTAALTFPKSTLTHHWTVKVGLNVLGIDIGYEKWQASQNSIDSKSIMKYDVSLCS